MYVRVSLSLRAPPSACMCVCLFVCLRRVTSLNLVKYKGQADTVTLYSCDTILSTSVGLRGLEAGRPTNCGCGKKSG